MKKEYEAFLKSKQVKAYERGLSKVPELSGHLFQFQRAAVEFNLRVGTSGLFLDTGLGKTECQLEWCQKAIEATNSRALILTPLSVAGQTKRRADKYGYEARVIRDQSEAGPGINIINYDRLDKIDPTQFGIVSLDEASILKSFTGKTTRALIDTFRGYRFRLVATATPAPNDHMEIGQYSEFLEIMPSSEMLMRWFIADQTEMGRYRLKGHAVTAFWDWMASWSRMAEKPSDLGDTENDTRFTLPPFEVTRHRAKDSRIDRELSDMFGAPQMSATGLHEVKRQTSESRADEVASVVAADPAESWLIWVDTDYETDAVKRAIPNAVDVRGSMTAEQKEERIAAFEAGEIRYLIGKPSMLGYGLDWSHCARMAFVGRSYSYETWYQAVRRCWRFGQTRTLQVHLIVAEGEDEIGRVIDRKADDHAKMKRSMYDAMRRANQQSSNLKVKYNPTHIARMPSWIYAA
jgi:hypothetical protein